MQGQHYQVKTLRIKLSLYSKIVLGILKVAHLLVQLSYPIVCSARLIGGANKRSPLYLKQCSVREPRTFPFSPTFGFLSGFFNIVACLLSGAGAVGGIYSGP